MVNTELFEKKVKESGKKKNYLAKKVGLSSTGFRKCIVNKAEFKLSQVTILCEEIGVKTLAEKEAIFFAKSGS